MLMRHKVMIINTKLRSSYKQPCHPFGVYSTGRPRSMAQSWLYPTVQADIGGSTNMLRPVSLKQGIRMETKKLSVLRVVPLASYSSVL
jgi:hypothetical protein